MTTVLPLDGLRVLALEHAIAAPLCTRQLAELGADVIKVERRGSGDFARAYDDRVKGQSSHFIWVNRSKRSLTLDLKHAQAAQILQRLLADCDVLVQNLAPGATVKLGLDFASLHPKYQRLIVCDISGYGSHGPYRDRKAYDLLIQSEAGFLSVTGNADQPAKAGISIADIAAGTQAVNSILAALLLRDKTGQGSHIEISLLEAMVEWMGFPLHYASDGQTAPLRSGTDHSSIYPYGAFASADGREFMIGIQNEREWQAFCSQVLQQKELADDPRFNNNSRRSAARRELKSLIDAVLGKTSSAELISRLDTAKIAYASINDLAEVWNHPQLKALQRRMQVNTPAGLVDAFLPPGNNNAYAAKVSAVPSVGEHTDQILLSAGFSAQEIARFRQDEVV